MKSITYFRLFLFSMLMFASGSFLAQTATATPANEEDALKKVTETKLSEVITIPDSLPASELLKRAVNWVKVESNKYIKASGATTGSKVECSITFFTKPKELNPEVDYTGKITMKVSIECKDSKYRYTINQIRHVSKSGQTSGGSIDNTIPECGSMNMGDLVWKKLKGEAVKDANLVLTDLKAGMEKSSTDVPADEW
jgi:hypothetical protein